uniref:Uncharacterized protein n=1 Tax=uncultured gamma proteobacterium HF0070_08D07 TaxID=710983 RepID=E0XRX7_9GAMM|nr:hypothetical protein [uncultured gamma proteobacterium HF0070_08D07]
MTWKSISFFPFTEKQIETQCRLGQLKSDDYLVSHDLPLGDSYLITIGLRTSKLLLLNRK